jgi:hypothetical protein
VAHDRDPGPMTFSFLRRLLDLIAWAEPFDYEDDD